MKRLDLPNITAKGPDQDGHLIFKLVFGAAAFIPKHDAITLAQWILETYKDKT